jgi:hypothetical protein
MASVSTSAAVATPAPSRGAGPGSERRVSDRLARSLNTPPELAQAHLRHMRRVAVVLALLTAIVFLMNRQILRETVLVNSPSYDALVYQNASYDDYYVVRQDGLGGLLRKYTSGVWAAPPLYSVTGAVAYALFGRDPANFYVVPAVAFFFLGLSSYGFVHHWTAAPAWAALAAALVLTVPSVVTFGLRVSQIDFTVGVVFTCATYALVASDGLRRRGWAAAYAASVALCLLLKSTMALYFLAHVVIWLIYTVADRHGRLTRLGHATAVVIAVAIAAGWFYVANLSAIIAYYVAFGTTFSNISSPRPANSAWIDELLFYWRSFVGFHLGNQYSLVYAGAAAVSLGALLATYVIRPASISSRIAVGILLSVIWLAVPYAILSAYASKASAVDFPFLATFFIIPILAVAAVVRRGVATPAAMLIFAPLLLGQATNQVNNLTIAAPSKSWYEQEIDTDIFADATQRGLQQIDVGNAFVGPQLTSENLRYYTLNGTFDEWRGKLHPFPLGYFFDVESYYQSLLNNSDYVVAKTDVFVPPQHPDNVLAPALNVRLANSPSFQAIRHYELPDGTQLILYRTVGRPRFGYPPPMADGWIGPHFPITLGGPPRDTKMRVVGTTTIPPGLSYPLHLVLEDRNGAPLSRPATIERPGPFDVEITVPGSVLATGIVALYLNSDRVYRPVEYGLGEDTRLLMLRLASIELEPQ